MLSEIERRTRKGESFAFETTLSGHVYARLIPRWQGWLPREIDIFELAES